MSDAPPRIQAWLPTGLRWDDIFAASSNYHPTDGREIVAFIRADLVAAQIAAAVAQELETCAKACDRITGNTADFNHYARIWLDCL